MKTFRYQGLRCQYIMILEGIMPYSSPTASTSVSQPEQMPPKSEEGASQAPSMSAHMPEGAQASSQLSPIEEKRLVGSSLLINPIVNINPCLSLSQVYLLTIHSKAVGHQNVYLVSNAKLNYFLPSPPDLLTNIFFVYPSHLPFPFL